MWRPDMIAVKENIIDFIRNNIKATLSLNAIRQLNNDSWKQSKALIYMLNQKMVMKEFFVYYCQQNKVVLPSYEYQRIKSIGIQLKLYLGMLMLKKLSI